MKISNLRRIANFLVFESETQFLLNNRRQTVYFPISTLSIIEKSSSVTILSSECYTIHTFKDNHDRNAFMFELHELITKPEKQQTVRWDMPNPDLLTELK